MEIKLPELKEIRRAELYIAGGIMIGNLVFLCFAVAHREKFSLIEFYPFVSGIEAILVFVFSRLLRIYESRLPLPDLYEASQVLNETMKRINELLNITIQKVADLKGDPSCQKILPPR